MNIDPNYWNTVSKIMMQRRILSADLASQGKPVNVVDWIASVRGDTLQFIRHVQETLEALPNGMPPEAMSVYREGGKLRARIEGK